MQCRQESAEPTEAVSGHMMRTGPTTNIPTTDFLAPPREELWLARQMRFGLVH